MKKFSDNWNKILGPFFNIYIAENENGDWCFWTVVEVWTFRIWKNITIKKATS